MLLKLGLNPVRLGRPFSNLPHSERIGEKCKTLDSEPIGHGFSSSKETSCVLNFNG